MLMHIHMCAFAVYMCIPHWYVSAKVIRDKILVLRIQHTRIQKLAYAFRPDLAKTNILQTFFSKKE